MVLLRLSLAAYRLQRAIGIEGVFSRTLAATRGITAGSGFATAELKALLLTLMQLLHHKWAELLVLHLFVDDLTITVVGCTRQVVNIMIRVLDFVVDYLEDTLLMEVSAKKSKLIGSSKGLVQAIVVGTRSAKVSAAKHGKVLGTDDVGGRVRSTVNFRARLTEFGEKATKFKALRKIGVNSPQMVRAAGTPAVTYGCHTVGISDTGLHSARSKIAAAASPDAGGRNPILVLMAIDGPTGTLDPAFEAHVGPLKHWALAVWEKWQPIKHMQEVFSGAALKLAEAKGSVWSRVHGPTTALIASIERIGWHMPSATDMVSDEGQIFDLLLDPPVAIVNACKDSVRKWRIRAAGNILPGLIPVVPDVGPPIPSPADRLIMALGGVSALLKGKPCRKSAGPVAKEWHPRAKGSLTSAITGGQWTQARKAAVTAWGIEDSTCQLCHKEVGTIEHRFQCSATRPSAGWPSPPQAADQALILIGERRRHILRTRGLAVLRMPPRAVHQDGQFRWLLEPNPNDPDLQEAVWYCDGSLLFGKHKEIRVTGFGLAVATKSGRLLGYGLGWPPSWCATAAAAEAWAMHTVLDLCPFPPQMRTDCLALLQTAQAGTSQATKASKPLARVWKLIAATLGTDVSFLTESGVLVWVPAHLSHAAIGESKLSNGTRLSCVDWRANRLVDKLAKTAAAAASDQKQEVKVLESFEAATTSAAALLGLVTHAANNHRVAVEDDTGKVSYTSKRDSVDKPRGKKPSQCNLATTASSTLTTAAKKRTAEPPSSAPAFKVPRKDSALSREKRRATEALNARVRAIGESLRPRESNTNSLDSVRQRVLARLART